MALGAVDLNLLVALRALLEEENVTRAGERLDLGQPAMSAALARLRRHFGDELLVRVGRDFELTPFARSLLPQVRESVRLLGDAMRVTGGFDPATSTSSLTVALSDYALAVLHEPVRRRIKAVAPGVRLAFTELGDDLLGSERALLRQDLLVGPPGYGFAGQHLELFRDRLVCVADGSNPYLLGGFLGLEAFRRMPHAVAVFPGGVPTPADRAVAELGIDRRVSIRVHGFLPLLFAVRGTDAVAVVPERIARRFAGDALVVVEPPFPPTEMTEAAWWHPSRQDSPAHRWFLSVLHEVAVELR
ncbi:LysR family transcriptional regulator [Actinoplanes sp. NPDC026619]|uniref:LysR family transcriptional regulator n=1 Tax=Actinoplanes sp. NPDC026619 TaxID=3155798 RepID=UPI00340E7336